MKFSASRVSFPAFKNKPFASLALTFMLAATSLEQASWAETAYTVDGNNSIVSFATIKKQYIVEPATFNKLSGQVSAEGDAEFSIDLASLDTSNPVRDQRLLELFFKVTDHPTATVKAKIDMQALAAAATQNKMQLPATLELYGNTHDITLDVLVSKLADGQLLVTSIKPLIISARDYAIPAENLAALAGTVDNIPLSDTVALNFILTLHK